MSSSYDKAKEAYNNKSYEEAIVLAKSCISDSDVKLEEAYRTIGLSYFCLENYEQALYYFQKVRDISECAQDSFNLMAAAIEEDNFTIASEQLEYLGYAYGQIGETDPTYLHIRGIPSLESTLDIAKKIFKNSTTIDKREWVENLSQKVSYETREYLLKFLEET